MSLHTQRSLVLVRSMSKVGNCDEKVDWLWKASAEIRVAGFCFADHDECKGVEAKLVGHRIGLPEKSERFYKRLPEQFVHLASERAVIPVLYHFIQHSLSAFSDRCPQSYGFVEFEIPSIHDFCYVLLFSATMVPSVDARPHLQPASHVQMHTGYIASTGASVFSSKLLPWYHYSIFR